MDRDKSTLIILFSFVSYINSHIIICENPVTCQKDINICDILQELISTTVFNVLTLSRSEPSENSSEVFKELHQFWYDKHNLTFFSFEDSKLITDILTCIHEPENGLMKPIQFMVKQQRAESDPDTDRSERNTDEFDEVCFPKIQPSYPLWLRAIHIILEPRESNVDKSSVFKTGRKIVEFKPYSDVLLIFAHNEYFLKTTLFQSEVGNFTFKIGILQDGLHSTVFRYCLFCNASKSTMVELQHNDELLLDTSSNLHGLHMPGICTLIDSPVYDTICDETLEISITFRLLCDISRKLNFTWSMNGIYSDATIPSLSHPNTIVFPFQINIPWLGSIGEPYRMAFTNVGDTFHFTFVTRPPHKIFYWYNFFLPFAFWSWVFVLANVVIVTSLLFLIAGDYKLRTERIRNACKSGLLLLRQHIDQCPRFLLKSSLRIITGSWLFYCLVVNTGFKAKLYSFLTVPMKEKIPRDFQELYDSVIFTPAGSEATISIISELLSDVTNEDDIFEKVFKSEQFLKTWSLYDCLKLIKEGKDIACIDSDYHIWRKVNLEYEISSIGNGTVNSFHYADEIREIAFLTVGIWREMPYFPHINHVFQGLLDYGAVQKNIYRDVKLIGWILQLRNFIHQKNICQTNNCVNDYSLNQDFDLKKKRFQLYQLHGVFFGFSVYDINNLLFPH